MFAKKIRKALKSKPDKTETYYCVVVNNDNMLFFPSEIALRSYVKDYEKRMPIYNISLFKTVFNSLI